MFNPSIPGNLNKPDPGNVNGSVWAKPCSAAILAAAILVFFNASARAQSIDPPATVTDDMLGLLAPKPHSTSNPLLRPGREYRGIAAGDWMFYPSLLVGAVYDDNLTWLTSNKVSAVGTRLAPRFVAVRNTGIHKTSIYGDVDARIYPSLARGNAINAQAGIEHVWEVGRDFSIRLKAEYARKALHIDGGLVSTASGSYMLATPLTADQLSASVTVKKSFGKAFVGVSAETVKTSYDDLHVSGGRIPQQYRDSWVNTLAIRAGYWIAPSVYAFGELSGNVRAFDSGPYASRGYRAVAGLGSDRISLFRGEVYAGVQQQSYENAQIKSAARPVVGGAVYWYPTRDLTIRAMVDQSFTDSAVASPGNPQGYPQKLSVAQLSINYQFARDILMQGRISYEQATYLGLPRRDQAWRGGMRLSYEMYRNVDVALDYDYTNQRSNEPTAAYTRNAFTLSAKFKY